MPTGPAAKMGDQIVATDTHVILVPSPAGPVPTPTPMPFVGIISGNCSTNVLIESKPAATLGSTAINMPPHIPWVVPSPNRRPTRAPSWPGSGTVLINNKPAARMGDQALTCNDPFDLPVGTVVVSGGTVIIGG